MCGGATRGAVRFQVVRQEPHRQRCKVCGNADKFDFTVPDSTWEAAVPGRFRGGVVCLPCFDDFARENNVDYAADLSALFFAGDQATFEFAVASAMPTPTDYLQSPARCLARH